MSICLACQIIEWAKPVQLRLPGNDFAEFTREVNPDEIPDDLLPDECDSSDDHIRRDGTQLDEDWDYLLG
jgi:hypothetical protein